MKKILLGSVLAVGLALPSAGYAGTAKIISPSSNSQLGVGLLVVLMTVVILSSRGGLFSLSTQNAESSDDSGKGAVLMEF